jgi:hypothetical protein
MSNPTIEVRAPITTAAPHVPAELASRLKAAALAVGREIGAFLQAVSEARTRTSMIEHANSVAATRPELAARLRRAATETWS